MPALAPLLDALDRELAAEGLSLVALLKGFARVLPSVILVPAFGLSALPLGTRVAFGLGLAASFAPSLASVGSSAMPFGSSLLGELAIGLPVAATAAFTIWAAAMAGGVFDALGSGTRKAQPFPGLGADGTPFAILLGLGACAGFLELGGPARLAVALSTANGVDASGLVTIALGLARSVQVAVAIAAPLLVASLFVALLQGLLIRVAHPELAVSLAVPVRQALIPLGVGLLLDRVLAALLTWMSSVLPPAP